MLERVFTKSNIIANLFMTVVVFLVYVIFLGLPVGVSFGYCIVFFGVMFIFDWLIVILKDRA